MGWNEGPSRNFFSSCFGEFQLTGKLDGLFQGPRGGNLQFQNQKKKDSTPAEILKLSLLTTALRVLPATLMPVITTSLAIHLEGQFQGAYRSWRAFFSDLPSPLPGTFMHPCNTCFLLCTCVMFYASMLYTFSLVYLCMMFHIRIHK